MSNTQALRIRNLMFRTEAALESDNMGEATNPAHQDRLEAATRFISATEAPAADQTRIWA